MTHKRWGRTTAFTAVGAAGMLLAAACGPNYGNSNGGSSGGTANTASQAGRVSVAKTSAGKVLTDPQGHTLYVFARDTRGHSNCTGSCATYWPIAPGADANKGMPAAVSAKLGSIHRSDGASQLTVNGFPAYTYVGDHGRGQANGQGLNISGGLWWVISPSGTKVTSSSGSSSSSTTSGSSGSSGSSGYGY